MFNKMGFAKEQNEKEFVCRQCTLFLDAEDLVDGNCPECYTDDCIFNNDMLDE